MMWIPRILVCSIALFGLAAKPTSGLIQEANLILSWEIGGVSGPEETLWQGSVSAQIIDSAVYVVDHRAPSVQRFGLDGTFVLNLGREGQGPGEYAFPAGVRAFGDSIGVWDRFVRRWALFTRDGEHLRTGGVQPYPETRYASIEEHYGLVHGFHLGVTGSVVDDSEAFPQAVIEWSQPTPVDTVASFPATTLMFRRYAEGQWNPRGWPMGPSGDIDIRGDTVFILNGLSPKVSVLLRGPRGTETVSEHVLPGAAKEIDGEMREAILERFLLGQSEEWREFNFRFPETIPAWSGINVASDTLLWLRKGGEPQMLGGTEEWVAWSPQAGLGSGILLKPGERLLDAAGNHLLVTSKGEFDEVYLRLYRVERR